MKTEIKINPNIIFEEYKQGQEFKASMYDGVGLYKQNKKNERFYSGDQWKGANCGNSRPLVRYNVIKRIGDYKIAMVSASPISVNYSADGIPNTVSIREQNEILRKNIGGQKMMDNFTSNNTMPDEAEINFVMDALGEYYNTSAERVKLSQKLAQAVRDAYVSGTGILYTYWDDTIQTGLYADEGRTQAIKGDVDVEALDVENVYLGDTSISDIQKQPYIIIAQRKTVKEVKRIAKMNKASSTDIENIKADQTDIEYYAGDRSSIEQEESKKVTLLTKFWKEYDENGNYVIKAIQVTKNATVKKEWQLKNRIYPFAMLNWGHRKNCAYGESEVTYLIPNQIAINRMASAAVWCAIMNGMPIMVVDEDIIQDPITNEPGQIVYASGSGTAASAIGYINPPSFVGQFGAGITELISNTLTHSGANDAALGDMNPENTSAIIAVREAATLPLQTVQNDYYQFCEDQARVFADYWVNVYGERSLKVEDDSGIWYLAFNGDRYNDLVISAKIDVGAASLWSESQSIRTLDNLFERQIIDVIQYLTRLPKGTVPDVTGLIREMKEANSQAAANLGQGSDISALISQLPPEQQELFASMTPEEQQAVLAQAQQNAGGM